MCRQPMQWNQKVLTGEDTQLFFFWVEVKIQNISTLDCCCCCCWCFSFPLFVIYFLNRNNVSGIGSFVRRPFHRRSIIMIWKLKKCIIDIYFVVDFMDYAMKWNFQQVHDSHQKRREEKRKNKNEAKPSHARPGQRNETRKTQLK